MNRRVLSCLLGASLLVIQGSFAANKCVATSEQVAAALDADDPLAYTKELFDVPPGLIHFGGHSLGPTYKGSVERVLEEFSIAYEDYYCDNEDRQRLLYTLNLISTFTRTLRIS